MKSLSRITIALLVAATLALALTAPAARAQMSSREKSFVEGLQRRGLLTLLETLLNDMQEAGADPMAIQEQKAALFQMRGLQATSETERADAFDQAEEAYRELIAGLEAKAAEAEGREQDSLRLQVLDLKVRLGELLWMHRPANQLNILELTDKEIGDRAMVEKNMRAARGLFQQVRNDAQAWSDAMAADPEYERRYLNSGVYDKVALYNEFSRYRIAWTSYYLGYVLEKGSYNVEVTQPGTRPSEVVRVLAQNTDLDEDQAANALSNLPQTVARGLNQEQADSLKSKINTAGATSDLIPEQAALLEQAEKLFIEFSELGDSREKWDSHRMLGMCYREQGLFDQAVESLRAAIDGAADSGNLKGSDKNNFIIQCYYELIQTALKAKRYDAARQYLTELKQQNYPELPQSFIGSQLLPFLDAKIDLAQGAEDPQMKDRGLKKLETMWRAGGPLQLIITGEIRKYIDTGEGEQEDIASLKPFELWIKADETYGNKDYVNAARYFERYIEITQPDNPTHREAMFNLAVCYYRLANDPEADANEVLELKNKAANRFFEVASRFPDFHSVGRAAESFVLLRSEIYVDNPTDENLDRYANALKWSLDNRTDAAEAADMRWLYGSVLQKQGEYRQAAQQFERVKAEDSPNFYEAKYQAAICYRLDLLEVQWPKLSNDQIPRVATETVSKMEQYVNWAADEARRVGSNGGAEAKRRLHENAAQMLIWAAEILSLEQVQQFERSLRLLDQCEEQFPEVAAEQKGAILKVKIYDYIAQNRLDKVTEVLEAFVQSAKPGEVEPVLTDLFARISEDIDRLIRQNRKQEVRDRVLPLADQIGTFFVKYLGSANRESDVPFVLYQLAEMHRRAEDFEGPKGAIERYLNLITFDPYDKREKLGEVAVDIAYIKGLAESTQRVVDVTGPAGTKMTESDPRKAYDYLRRSAFYWSTVADGYDQNIPGMSNEEQRSLWWDAKYNHLDVMIQLHPLEQRFNSDDPTDYREVVRSFLLNFKATGSDFGGAANRVKFGRLAAQLGVRWP